MSRINLRVCLLGAILGALAACGGGGGTADSSAASPPVIPSAPPPAPAPPPASQQAKDPTLLCAAAASAPGSTPGGIEGTGIGPARRLKNLIVAGHAWDISHASVMIDGQPATTAQIINGLVTIVQGTTAATAMGTADSVVSETRVAGPITSADASGSALVVLGQPVKLTQQTGVPSPALAVGDTVEVNALATADGTLVATRVARRAADLEYFVTGTVSSHADGTHRLVINGLTVDYSSAVPQGFPSGAIHDGDLVRVFGRLPGGSTTLSARAVEFRLATPPGPVGEQIGLDGYVTRFTSSADFDVDGVPITTSAATDFEPLDLLALSAAVTVCGTLSANGHVAATRVVIEGGGISLPNLAGTIQSVNAPAGVLQILGTTVTADATTTVLDALTGSPQALALSDLRIGDSVWVYGGWVYDAAVQAATGLAATQGGRIERRNPSTAFIVCCDDVNRPGTQQSVSAGKLYVNRISVVLDQQTRYFGSCGTFGVGNGWFSPAWGPCSGSEFWPSFWGLAGPIIPSVMVAGAIRQSDGAPVASAVAVMNWE